MNIYAPFGYRWMWFLIHLAAALDMVTKTKTPLNIWMATAALDIEWYQTTNATIAHYRNLTVHIGKGPPVLVGGWVGGRERRTPSVGWGAAQKSKWYGPGV